MLQAIRSRAGSLVVKVLFGLLILTFGVWGIGDIFRNRPADTVIVTVGDQKIHGEELQAAVRRELDRLREEVGTAIDAQRAKKMGIVDSVLEALIDRSVADQEAVRLRLDVSDEVIRGAVADNPRFRAPDGRFDRALFNAVLAQSHLNEDQFVAMMRRDIPLDDLLQALTAGAAAPQSLTDPLYRYRNEKRVADMVTLSTAEAGDVGQPSETELTGFYDTHQDLFRTPEYRGFTLVSLSPSDIEGIEIPEAKLKEEFDQRQDELQLPEQREVQQILAPSEEKAKEAAAALAAGKDWKDVATTIAGQDPETIELGLMRRNEMPKMLSDIVFDLPLNTASEPVKTPLGWHILRVVKIEAPVIQTYEQAKPKLEAELSREEAEDRIYKITNRIDDALASGASLEDVAAKFRLKTTLVADADLKGTDLERKPVALPLPANAVLKLVFATGEGRTSRVTEGPDGGILAVRVSKVTAPAVKPLAEVKDQAIEGWQAGKRREKVARTAEELAAAVKPDIGLAAVAAERGFKAATSPPLSRQPSRDETTPTPPALLAKLFAAKPGQVVTAADASRSYVAQLTKVEIPETPPPDIVKNLGRELTEAMRGDLVAEYTQALRRRVPVEIRSEAVDRLF
jgi:peptidyl-prolyl cis-trans isomerase D